MPTQTQRSGYKIVFPSKSRIGRLRRAIKRAFILSGGQPITIGDILPRAYPRLKRVPNGHRSSVRRALRQEARVIGRNRFGRGRPNLWAPQID